VASYSGSSSIWNSFQAAIATNGRHSFAVFNYGQMSWTKGGSAQVGFNSGLDDQANCSISSSCFVVEGSRTEEIINISRLSNVGIPGKWIFRVDQEHVEEGGCNTGGFLIFSPNNVYFLGGEEVSISSTSFLGSVPKKLDRFKTETFLAFLAA
jgi:hypothetical protein